jgi:hypothetical protein
MNQKKHMYTLLKFTSLAILFSSYSCSSKLLEIDSSEVRNFSNFELCGILAKGRYSESAKSAALSEIEKRKFNCAEDFEEIITDNPKGIKMGN